MGDPIKAARLREARRLAGFDTAAQACTAFGWTYSTYNNHENADRGFDKRILTYVRAFRVREEWLRYGRGSPRETAARQVLLSGIVGPFGIISEKEHKMPKNLAATEVDAPPVDGDFTAYRVEGEFNYPALFDGDVIYTMMAGDPEASLGRQCVAELPDGSRRVCLLTRGTVAGLYMLVSFNASPIPDAEVAAAAPIVWIKRG